MTYLVLGCRGLLVGTFLVSLLGALRGRTAYRAFVTATAQLLAVSERTGRLLAALTVAAEAGVVATLTVSVTLTAGFVAATGLLSCFTAVLLRALHRGTDRACHCFGASGAPVGPHHVVRDLVLIVAAATGLVARLVAPPGGYHAAGVLLTAFVVLVGVLLVSRLDDLATLWRTPTQR